MNSQIRKLVKNSRKKFIRHVHMRFNIEWQDLIDLLAEFGLFVYCDPSTIGDTDEAFFITNRRMTVGDFVKWYTVTYNNQWAKNEFEKESYEDELELA